MSIKSIKLILLFVLLMSVNNAFSQTVEGIVSSLGEPLPGVSVTVKGTAKGTYTNFEGQYIIDGLDSNSVLVFSFIGFTTQEVIVGNQTKIDVELVESKEMLKEIVLIGYGQSQNKKTISTAISTIDTKTIEQLPVARVENLLQGNAPGVVLQQNSGEPGSTATIRIRGVGSPNSSDPLYIVDGFPVPNLQFLNPNEIKNITILKDAASTAVYGSRGSNGVVLVETKSGRKYDSKPSISINGYTGFQKMGYKPDLMNASEYINYYNQAVAEAGGNLNGNRGAFTEEERNLLPNTDWYDATSRTASMSDLAVSLSDGGNKYSYTLSGGLFEQEGIFSRGDNTRYTRKNIRSAFYADVRDNLKIGITTNIANMTNSYPVGGIGNSNSLPAIYPAYAENGELFNPGRQNPSPSYNGVPLNVMGAMTNPLWALNDFGGSERVQDVKNYGATINWKPIKDLKIDFSYNYFKNNTLDRSFNPSLGAVYPEQDFFLVGFYSESPTIDVKNQFSATAEYTFSKLETTGHNLKVLAGHEVLDSKLTYGGNIVNVGDYLTYDFDDVNFALAANPSDATFTPSKIAEVGLVSYFTRANYNYKEKYLATASFRIDKSSNFGENFRSGFFPSFSAGWLLSKEDFLSNSSWINLLKLRTSWGISGIDNSPKALAYLSTISSNVSYGENPGLSLTGLANPNLKWEELEQFNIGVDLSVFKNTFDISLDYYSKETSDILLQANTPSSSGLNPSVVNVGNVKNSGYEVAFSYKKNSDIFSWNASLNIAYNKNEVTNLGENTQGLQGGFTGALFSDPITLTNVGHPIASFYGFQVEGMDANGNLLFKDLDGSGNDRRTPDATDKTFIGKPLPDYTAGLNLGASYSGFDLTAFFYGATGNDIFDATIAYTAIGSNRPSSYLQEGAPRNMAVAAPGDSNGEDLVSDFHIKDGSFIKLKNVALGYSLPNSIVKKLKAEKMRFYISGQNLFTVTKYKGVDPEVGGSILSMGIDTGFYPQSRSYLLGFQINF